VSLGLQDLEKRLALKDIILRYDTKVLNFITKDVYNPDFGAREVRRYIVDIIEDTIAEKMITGNKTKKEFVLSVVEGEIVVR
jgi:ATP-dependent Clp protease ATP-binding subunit ClpA